MGWERLKELAGIPLTESEELDEAGQYQLTDYRLIISLEFDEHMGRTKYNWYVQRLSTGNTLPGGEGHADTLQKAVKAAQRVLKKLEPLWEK